MRPVNKGDEPRENGALVEFKEYGDARPYLIERLGDYCSYCEVQITNPATEHIQPKRVAPGIETNWYNLLLSCANCNSIKGDEYLDLCNYYWPDIHNTFLLFEFHPFGVVTIKNTPHTTIDKEIVEKTLNLTGLNRYGTTISVADRRWIKRGQTYGKAKDALQYYISNNKPADYILSITNTATSTGFWSIWMQIFEMEDAVITELMNVFPNTYSDCVITNIKREI